MFMPAGLGEISQIGEFPHRYVAWAGRERLCLRPGFRPGHHLVDDLRVHRRSVGGGERQTTLAEPIAVRLSADPEVGHGATPKPMGSPKSTTRSPPMVARTTS